MKIWDVLDTSKEICYLCLHHTPSSIITSNFRKNHIIKNHHKENINDKYAPAWKTLEFFTFGTVLKMFQNLKDKSLKHSISLQYDIRSVEVFVNYFRAIVDLRNLCSHGSVLFDHNLSYPLRNGIALKIDDNNSKKMSSVIKILHYVLRRISSNRAKEMENEINRLFSKPENMQIIKNIDNISTGKINF